MKPRWDKEYEFEQSLLTIPLSLWATYWNRVTLPSYWLKGVLT